MAITANGTARRGHGRCVVPRVDVFGQARAGRRAARSSTQPNAAVSTTTPAAINTRYDTVHAPKGRCALRFKNHSAATMAVVCHRYTVSDRWDRNRTAGRLIG